MSHLRNLVHGTHGHKPLPRRLRGTRTLRPVRPKKANEIWYRGKLLGVVAHTRTLILAALAKTKEHWVMRAGDSLRAADADKPHPDAAGKARAVNSVLGVKHDMPGLSDFATETAAAAAKRNAASVDEAIEASVRQGLEVEVGPILKSYGPLSQAMQQSIKDNYALIKSLPDEMIDKCAETIGQAWEEGLGWEQASKMIDIDFDTGESRARLIARDQTNKMAGQFNRERQTQIGVEKFQWICSHVNSRPEHLAMETGGEKGDGVYRWDEPGPLAGTIDGEPCFPGDDIQCFPGGSQIHFANHVEKAYRRWYSGQLAEVVTASGKTLCGTPNHPVLSLRGWLPIGELDESDHVIEVAEEVLKCPEVDPKNRVPNIAQVFQLASDMGLAESAKTVGTDFHGDGLANGNIDIVLPARPLLFDFLTGGTQVHAIGSRPMVPGVSRDAERAQVSNNRDLAHSDELKGFLDGLPFPYKLSRVVKTSRVDFAGHVFNLQTLGGWYVTNGIVAHNCNCCASPVVDLDDDNTNFWNENSDEEEAA